MIAKVAAVGMLFCVIAMTGCQTAATTAGPVTTTIPAPGWEKGPAVGLTMPRIAFTGLDGKKQWLRGDTEWITLVAFVPTQGKECNYLLPSLVEAAGRYYNKPVRVVQMAQPEKDVPNCESCVESGHVHLLHLIALCDATRAAYHAFGHPAPDTLLLIGGDGKVIAVSSLEGLPSLCKSTVDGLAAQLALKQLPEYAATYND
jgi:hypothetical protein